MELTVYNMLGSEVDKIQLDEMVFGAEYNEALIHQVIIAQLANRRQGTKSALTRTEVSGGGRKPWRQKGTGNARQGSTRSPQWRHGGVVFAPKPRDFSKKINKRMKTMAIISAISQKIRQDELIVVDDITIAEPKTKLIASSLKALQASPKTLMVLNGENDKVLRAAKNIEGLTTCDVELLNVYDLVRNGKCIIAYGAVKKFENKIKETGDND